MGTITIGDSCEVLNGYAFKSEKYTSSGIRVIRIANVQKGYIEDDSPVFYQTDDVDLNKYMLRENDLLVSLTGNVGRTALLTKDMLPAALNQRVACLRLKTNKITRGFLFHLLNSDYFESKCIQSSQGVAQKNLSTEWLKSYDLPLYSLSKQNEITKILDNVRNTTILKEQEIQKYDELIKARFIEMFGEPVNNDKVWVKDSVERLCREIYGGGTPSKSHPEYYEGGKIPWITSKDMKTDILIDSQIHINEDGVANSTARIVPKNSVIMVIRSGILKHTLPVAINAVPVTVNQDLKVFVAGNRIVTKFLAYQFKMMERDILSGVRAVTADNIEFDALKRRELIVPPIELQQEFADFVEQVDKSREAVKKSLEKTQQLYDSLMQEYFG